MGLTVHDIVEAYRAVDADLPESLLAMMTHGAAAIGRAKS